MSTGLWTEIYRPKTVEEYVFRDESQRKQVLRWIKDKSLPHLLLSGIAGTGKCLGGNEHVIVQINTTTLSSTQLAELEKYKI